MIKYTKGPWKIERRTTPGQFVIETHIVSKDNSHIAIVSPVAIEENAKIISLAPEMVEALDEMRKTAIALADYAPAIFKNERNDLFADVLNAYGKASEILKKIGGKDNE